MRYDRILVVVVAGLLTLPAILSSQQEETSRESPPPLSHARVVRLSYVGGTVTLKRAGSAEEEKALLNTPIQEGYEISTASASYAEVEFENGSTARIGERSRLLFQQLALNANGYKLNGIAFEQGYATFHFTPEHGRAEHGKTDAVNASTAEQDVYRVKLASATITATGKCEFRTDLAPGRYRVEVFSGAVEVADGSETSRLTEGKILDRDSSSTTLASAIHQGIVKDDWDHWTEARDQQAELAQRDESVHPMGAAYGWSDLNTYGEWVTLPGGAFGWSPYVPMGWSPYVNGTWGWYSGFGWTWLSGDPWGWVTDHCSMWDYDASLGWFWMPPTFGCGPWYPSIVNWYTGPGWFGWRPARPTGPLHPRPGPGPHPIRMATQIATVSTHVLESRQAITPAMVGYVSAHGAKSIEQPPFQPRAVSENVSAEAATSRGEIRSATSSATAASGRAFEWGGATAPATILAGGDPAEEKSLLANHAFRLRRAPLRAAMGTTLGGRYRVGGTAGEFRGDVSVGNSRNGASSFTGRNSGPGITTRAGGTVISRTSGGSGVSISSHASSGASHSGGGSMGGGFSGGGSSGGMSHAGGSVGGGSIGGGSAGGASAGGGHH